ncbi:NAD(P)-binding protein [Aureobasidium pullulans EXF-150]|uniref:NAD(P)-binding protein n=1 Tax=Aureobasidium pullulans EXF-150 TaxID=1043002 RepID=A0A074YD95_AURPU|nr:NAD(P)-binding protein [Aureobasidium pullulans EXF-150]KEQ84826.1 NAD(P)-binding protein [Aureobasidium pullulans EXF-150]
MKLFVLGATGYIGGDALDAIVKVHPEYDITALVRNPDKGAQVAVDYPKVKLVYGDLDSCDLIVEESQKADIVCNWADADHEAAAKAIIKGLSARQSETPGYLIHTSGTGILMYTDLDQKIFGEDATKIHDDWDNIQEMITGIPDHAPHRNVDKVVQSVRDGKAVKSAIVCPPCIYGAGRGTGNQTSVQVPLLAQNTLKQGHGIQVGAGKTFWTQIHVHDLSDLYLKLVEAAAADGGSATWNDEGYYFCESGDLVWGEVAHQVAKSAHKQGFMREDQVKEYSPEEVKKLAAWGPALWGCNSRCRAIRAKKLLGWSASSPSLKDEIDATVLFQAKKMGLVPGHAKIAAGDA